MIMFDLYDGQDMILPNVPVQCLLIQIVCNVDDEVVRVGGA